MDVVAFFVEPCSQDWKSSLADFCIRGTEFLVKGISLRVFRLLRVMLKVIASIATRFVHGYRVSLNADVRPAE